MPKNDFSELLGMQKPQPNKLVRAFHQDVREKTGHLAFQPSPFSSLEFLACSANCPLEAPVISGMFTEFAERGAPLGRRSEETGSSQSLRILPRTPFHCRPIRG